MSVKPLQECERGSPIAYMLWPYGSDTTKIRVQGKSSGSHKTQRES